jgi:hypothetical protein
MEEAVVTEVVAHHQVVDIAEEALVEVRVVTEVVRRLEDIKVVNVEKVEDIKVVLMVDLVRLAEKAGIKAVALAEDTVMEVMEHLVHHVVSSLIVHVHQELNNPFEKNTNTIYCRLSDSIFLCHVDSSRNTSKQFSLRPRSLPIGRRLKNFQ